MISQTMNKLRAKLDRDLVAQPFSSLPAHKSIKHHEKLGKLLGIENPFFRSTEGPKGRKTLIDGKPVLNFAWCDYLGLSQHPDLIEAAKAAIDRYGTSISASRMVSGDTPLHRELEQEIAQTIGVEAALVFVSGHAANVSTIGTSWTTDDLIVHDEFVHNSAVVGMRLSGAKTLTYRHNNLDALEKILREERAKYRNALVVIEGLYSTEGDVPDLARVVEIKERYGAWLMVDDAHGCGVLGKHRRRPRRALRHPRQQGRHLDGHAQQGVCLLRRLHRRQPRADRYAALLGPGLRVLGRPAARDDRGGAGRAARHQARARARRPPARNGALFLKEAQARGLDTGRAIGIGMLPVMVGATTRAAKAVSQVLERGINTSLIMSPGVPVNAARLRFFLTCEVTADEIKLALQIVKEEIAKC